MRRSISQATCRSVIPGESQAATSVKTCSVRARAWRTALDPNGEWMPSVLKAAHIRLTQGNRAESKTMFDQANDWYSQCIKQADASPEDQFLADKIKAAGCVPYQKDVERALIDLQTAKP